MKLMAGSPTTSLLRMAGVLLALVLAAAMTAAAAAQQDSPASLLEDFRFYTMTANPDLAAANGEALLRVGLTDAEMAEMADDQGSRYVTSLETAFIRAQRIQNVDLETVAAEIQRRIEQGRMDLARDPARIDEAIQMLIGMQRQRMLGRARLVSAGEYAVPSLLREIMEGKDERLKNQCIQVIVDIGRQAVTPLCEALPELGDAVSQRVACDMLGDIGYPHGAPTLRDLADDQTISAPVRQAAERALGRLPAIEGRAAGAMSSSELYTWLSGRYFDEAESLIAFPDEETNNVWTYNPFVGLEIQPVATAIYSEIMAMRSAYEALQHDSRNSEALALYVASNLKRENELPDGFVDPIFGENRFTPDFYATYFGTQTCMDVLALAIDSSNTPLTRDAIRALSETTGGSNLFRGGQRQPLLEAIQYPDRRVQFESALTLAYALPQQSFPGDFAVVPLLSSAVRTGAATFALVVADQPEDQRTIANMLESLNFQIIGADSNVETMQLAILEAIGIDLVVVKKNDPRGTIDAINALNLIAKTSTVPTLIQASALDLPAVRNEFRTDRRILVSRAVADQETFGNQVDAILESAAGGRISETEAEIYAIEALSALRDIAISGTPAYDLADAEISLLEAMDTRTGGTRILVADILALIPTARAQQKLWDAALAATGAEQNDLLDHVAGSVMRFGNRAQPHQVEALRALVDQSAGDTAEAAARLHGAMNLAGDDAVLRVLKN